MKTISFFKKTPSWVLAILVLIVVTIALFVADELMSSFDRAGIIAFYINGILIAAGCFFIIANNPKSLWYVLIICNLFTLDAAYSHPNFLRSTECIPICIGWVLAIISSIIGARIGNRESSIG